MLKKLLSKKGFTLMELLIVIAIIAILAAIVLIAINPGRQLAKSRDAQRWSNVNTILNAVHQQALDNKGEVSTKISAICTVTQCIGTDVGAGCADISGADFVPTYLAGIPTDPKGGAAADTKYTICRTAENRVTVSAPNAEYETITATR